MSDNHTVILLRDTENYDNRLTNITFILQMCELYYYIKRLDAKRPVDLVGGTIAQVTK